MTWPLLVEKGPTIWVWVSVCQPVREKLALGWFGPWLDDGVVGSGRRIVGQCENG